MPRFLRSASIVGVALVALGLGISMSGISITVPAGTDLQRVLDSVPRGSELHLDAGTYSPVTVTRTVKIVGGEGVTFDGRGAEAVVRIEATGAELRDVTIEGGHTGVVVREANGVLVEDVSVFGAETHGIEIVAANATIRGARVAGLTSDYAQGIEIRNADGRPDSVIEDSTVIGGQEGIVSHVSEVLVQNNSVSGTTMRAITITEMSDGWVHNNHVTDAAGAGLFCGDMSRCQFTDNTVAEVAAAPGGRSMGGWGLVVHYHASASSHGDDLAGVAGASETLISSRITERSPLEPGAGSRAFWPAAIATLAALAALALIFFLVRWRLRRPLAERGSLSAAAAQGAFVAMFVGLAIQSFHMSEHFVQLWRVRVDGIPSRGGLVGPVVEAEWIHFFYNSAVWGLMLALVFARKRGWKPRGNLLAGDRLMVAAAILQGYHAFEHTIKLSQHLITGSKVNPGIAGNGVDLVLFHFSINLAVYVAFLVASLVYVAGARGKARDMSLRRTATQN